MLRLLYTEQSWDRPVSSDVCRHIVGIRAGLLSRVPRQGLADELSVIDTEELPLLLLVSVGGPEVVTLRVTVPDIQSYRVTAFVECWFLEIIKLFI